MFYKSFRSLCMIFVLSSLIFITACSQEPAQQIPAQSAEPPPPAPATLEQVKADLEEVKMAMANEGNYLCCVEPTCDWCMLKEGECACRDNLEAGKEVCAGCGLGWHNGEGVVEGVKASDVKWNIAHSHEESGGHEH